MTHELDRGFDLGAVAMRELIFDRLCKAGAPLRLLAIVAVLRPEDVRACIASALPTDPRHQPAQLDPPSGQQSEAAPIAADAVAVNRALQAIDRGRELLRQGLARSGNSEHMESVGR